MVDSRRSLPPADMNKPAAGFYWTRVVKNGPRVPVKIWFGRPRDPLTGEMLDRSPRWQALRNGGEIDVFIVWPFVYGCEITEEDYDHMLAVFKWAVDHAPEEPVATPGSAIQINKTPLAFSTKPTKRKKS